VFDGRKNGSPERERKKKAVPVCSFIVEKGGVESRGKRGALGGGREGLRP